MNKDIKDYLHLYLGCEVMCESQSGSSDPNIKKLTGISYDDTERQWWCYFENEDVGYIEVEFVKPILRPLSDMTGNELMEVFHLSYEDSGYKFSEPFEKVDNNDYGWRARNQNGMECFIPGNSFKPEVFRLLLSKHFDLFNLIPSGLAIDSTKVK